MANKTNPGNFFEDFRLGQEIRARHAAHGHRRRRGALQRRSTAAGSPSIRRPTSPQALGIPRAPIDDLLAFHLVFGKTVPDISLNAVANLGYAAGRFGEPVYPGDTLSPTSSVIGLKENKDGKTGIVYVRSSASTSAARWCWTTAAG